jgi:hypothetical protein
MFNFNELEKRYQNDAAFNKIVNLHRRLLEEFGFLPDEIRQAAFLAQYHFQTNQAEQIVRSEKEWEKMNAARLILQQAVLDIEKVTCD